MLDESIGLVELEPYEAVGTRLEPQAPELSKTRHFLATELFEWGDERVTTLFDQYPEFSGARNSEQQANAGSGSTGLNLRGAGTEYTAILINGQRAQMNSAVGEENGGFGNVTLIPSIALSGLTIYEGGLTSIYGADVIAGAVNFQFNRFDVDSLVRSSIEITPSGGGDSFLLSGRDGFASANTFAVVSGSYYNREALRATDRVLSGTTDYRSRGGTNRGSSSFPGRLTLKQGAIATQLTLKSGVSVPSAASDFRVYNQTDAFNYASYGPAIPALEVASAHASVYSQINTDTALHFDFLGTRAMQENGLAPAPWNSTSTPSFLTVARASPHFPFANPNDLTEISYRSLPLGELEIDWKREAYWANLGVQGATPAGFIWKAAAYGTRSDITNPLRGIADAGILFPLISNGQFNPFADPYATGIIPSGSNAGQPWDNAAALRSAARPVENQFKERLTATTTTLEHRKIELGSKRLSVIGGFEFREERVSATPDPFWATGNNLGGVTTGAYHGQRDAKSLFSEARLPILELPEDSVGITLTGASRMEFINDKGSSPTGSGQEESNRYHSFDYSAGLLIEPKENWKVRMNYATGFRAPSLISSFGAPSFDFPPLIDPSGYTPIGQAVPTRVQGNPALDPENANTLTIGFSYESPNKTGWFFSGDYYRMQIDNAVSNGAQLIVQENWAGQRFGFGTPSNFDPTAPFATKIIRDPGTGRILFVDGSYFNTAETLIQGFDITGDYTWKLDANSYFSIGADVNILLEYRQQLAKGAPSRDLVGTYQDYRINRTSPGALPRWKGLLRISWENADWWLGASMKYIPSYADDRGYTQANAPRDVKAYEQIDILIRHNLNVHSGSWLRNTSIALGVENLFDKSPPFAAGALEQGYDTSTYSIRGRSFTLTVSKHF